ncbi:hypothetical protein EH220_08420 [bacterium]|nr:MAG: hypothetical protein EH220_08420 [bacterium]
MAEASIKAQVRLQVLGLGRGRIGWAIISFIAKLFKINLSVFVVHEDKFDGVTFAHNDLTGWTWEEYAGALVQTYGLPDMYELMLELIEQAGKQHSSFYGTRFERELRLLKSKATQTRRR